MSIKTEIFKELKKWKSNPHNANDTQVVLEFLEGIFGDHKRLMNSYNKWDRKNKLNKDI